MPGPARVLAILNETLNHCRIAVGLPRAPQGFGGREISEQDLSEWKQGGHQDWLARHCARELAGDASELSEAAEGSLADHLSVVLSARYAALVSGWNGEMDDEFRRKSRALRTLCQDIVESWRGDHCAKRLRVDLDRLAEASKADEVPALEAVIEEVNQWPDVRQAFNDAFALLRQWKNGGTAEGGSGAEIQPDLTESNQLNEWKQRWAALPLLDFSRFEHSRLNGTPRHGRVRPHSERRSGGVTWGCKWVPIAPGNRKPNQTHNMTTQIKRIVVLLFVTALLTLVNTGCNTAKGFGKDVERTGEKIQDGTN